jgi:hypothetical protein
VNGFIDDRASYDGSMNDAHIDKPSLRRDSEISR